MIFGWVLATLWTLFDEAEKISQFETTVGFWEKFISYLDSKEKGGGCPQYTKYSLLKKKKKLNHFGCNKKKIGSLKKINVIQTEKSEASIKLFWLWIWIEKK